MPPHGAELARAEHAGDRAVTEGLGDDRRVVVGLAEEADAAPVAREDERAIGGDVGR